MAIKVAINGYGRIGRNILRALYEYNGTDEIKIVAVNSLGSLDNTIHLTKYDTTHGRFNAEVAAEGEDMRVNGDLVKVYCQSDPLKLPWKALDVDIVFECSGKFTERDLAAKHFEAGAKKVLLSAPCKGADATVVYGINHDVIKPTDILVSNASCTTNCLAPLVKPIHDVIGIETGLMVTVHAYTNDQPLLDMHHKDLHRARSATHSIIPTKTGATTAVGLVLPELEGRLDGYSLRVPTINVSLVDLTFQPVRPTTVEEVNQTLIDAANGSLKGVLAINDEPLVSIDFNHHPASSICDIAQTRVLNNMVKVMSWYDNEWGFSNRMLDVAKVMMG